MTELTLLRLDPIGVPPYSARGITQSLDPIDAAAQLARTVNGTLINLSDTAFQKYKSTITCTDQQQPALDGVWPGDILTVDCVQELCYLTSGGSPSRDIASTTADSATRTEGAFTFYLPRLTMMVTAYSKTFDEWGAVSGWSLDLEEV
ncbi:MAG: hypothetical protein EOR77_21645 [Mesorhizobium sp.]|uniref:hypothetical protein n=1 Tax=Mesorhizobium sp. TaxID=1871066 RepID=UPI000FE542E7|nr:hypothetical protein [Mesorhizobium sp.]RWH86455.1 MAG: hypothetical protein EOQ87_26550 [Mesorhizobium sp.]RWM32279.1 MAG: hypothetical protein EOR77_21645 [Mesorhizobium sp.]TJV33779.1 MAG: hypothetical protein E5X87_10625 [Mesorhizobium sp.]